MKKKVRFIERLMIAQVLPATGNFKTMIIAEDIRKKVLPTQKEMKDFDFEVDDKGGMKWNNTAHKKTFEIQFNDLEINLIVSNLKKLDKEEKLTKEMIDMSKVFDVKFD